MTQETVTHSTRRPAQQEPARLGHTVVQPNHVGVGQMRRKVITISRQRGSGGNDIAPMVAGRLGVPLYDREVIERTAIAAGVWELEIEHAVRYQGVLDRMLDILAYSANLEAERAWTRCFDSR